MRDAEQLELRESAEGTLLPVKAVAGASRDRVVGVLGGRLKVVTAAAPEKGKANAALAATLAKALGLARRDVRLSAGRSRPEKEFLIAGLAPAEVRARLETL